MDGNCPWGQEKVLVKAISFADMPLNAVSIHGFFEVLLGYRDQNLRQSLIRFRLAGVHHPKRIQIKRRTFAEELTDQLLTAQAFFFPEGMGKGLFWGMVRG